MTSNWHAAEGFLYDEERGLRDLLLGMRVSDNQSGGKTRDVGVWFSHPDLEVREQKYPYVLITLVSIDEATDRTMSWWQERPPVIVPGDGVPEASLEPESRVKLLSDNPPRPVNITYQIKTFARNPRHSRDLIRQLSKDRLPNRYGSVTLLDGTTRWVESLGVAHQEFVENSKRLLSSNYMLRITSWAPPETLAEYATYPTENINVDLIPKHL